MASPAGARRFSPGEVRQTHGGTILRIRDVSEPSASDIHVQAARDAGLRYVSDATAGIRRRSRGKAFYYERDDGTA